MAAGGRVRRERWVTQKRELNFPIMEPLHAMLGAFRIGVRGVGGERRGLQPVAGIV